MRLGQSLLAPCQITPSRQAGTQSAALASQIAKAWQTVRAWPSAPGTPAAPHLAQAVLAERVGVQDDGGALAGEGLRDGAPDAAGGARHQRPLVLKQQALR